MKLSQRLIIAVTATVAMYIFFAHLYPKPLAGSDEESKSPFEMRKRNLARSKHRRKVSSLVFDQDFGHKTAAKRQRESMPAVGKFNNKLSKLIFQLWDMKSMTSREESSLCTSLTSVDDRQYAQGKLLARKLNRRFYDKINASVILKAVSESCESIRYIFKFKQVQSYRTKDRDAYPIAFTVHIDRPAEQSLRMLYSIYHPDNVYCIQPNLKRGTPFVGVFRRITECVPNIVMPEKLYRVGAKTHDKLKAELACFEEVLKSNIPWRYGINLPSSAFPLRNYSFLVDYLRKKPYENYIDWRVLDEHSVKRIKYVHEVRELRNSAALVRTAKLKSPPPRNITLFRKGNYFVSTREFYRFLVNSTIAKELLAWSEDAKHPEEFFYASLHRHPEAPGGLPYHESDANSNVEEFTVEQENVTDSPSGDLIASLWLSDNRHRCRGAYRGRSCIFGAADLRWLIAQDNLFAMSFDYRIDRISIECLTRNLFRPIVDDTSVDQRDDLPPSV